MIRNLSGKGSDLKALFIKKAFPENIPPKKWNQKTGKEIFSDSNNSQLLFVN